MDVRVGWAEFDADGALDVRVGWAEFDATARPFGVFVGWAEFDTHSPSSAAVPPYSPGGGIGRYHGGYGNYNVPVDTADTDDEEEIILAILMEICAHVL